MKNFFLLLIFMFSFLNANNFFYEKGKKIELQPKASTKSLNSTSSANEVQEYLTIDGKSVKFKNEIIVTCKSNAYCEDDFSDLSISNYKEIYDNVFLISLDNQDIFDYCQKLYEKEDIQSAHPNFVRKIIKK